MSSSIVLRPIQVALTLFCCLISLGFVRGEDSAKALITVQEGNLPIIISAPHGGRKPIPNCPERKGGPMIKQFVVVNDSNTDLLASKVVALLDKKMKGKVHVVIAQFERKYLDVNRRAEDAYESPIAKPVYEAYHKALAGARKSIEKQWGRGILIDLHGQAADANIIFRGTNNGKSVNHLTDRFGKSGLTGPQSILGQLAKMGCNVFPANDSEEKENPKFGGGYITQTYGSRDGGRVDAIQLELGGKFRARAALDSFAENLSEAIVHFSREYLPAKPIAK